MKFVHRRSFVVAALLVALAGSNTARASENVTVAEIIDRLKLATAENYPSANSVVILDQTGVVVADSGLGETTHRRVIKVLEPSAVRRECVQRFGFDPTTNRMRIDSARIYHADGSIEEISPSSAVVQPAPAGIIFWGSQQMLLPVAGLRVGDALDVTYVKKGFNVAYLAADGGTAFGSSDIEPPMPGHWYDEVNFWSGLPVMEQRYTVRIPRDKPLQYAVYQGSLESSATLDGDQMVYSFVKRDITPFDGEPSMVSSRDTECKLVLATLPNWIEKARWFHEKNEASFEVDQSIRDKVNEVIADCADDDDKITRLNHWVAENIRYVGSTRGCSEGYTTHAAIETFRDRGGVCKDKAGLLVAMLRVAGFDSYIVMTQAGSEVERIPADQFNHAVTCVRHADGSLQLLDPTWMPKSRDNWSTAEQLQNVVYGLPEGRDLDKSGYSGPEENAVSWLGETRIDESGNLIGRVGLSAVGTPETNYRRSLSRTSPDRRDAWFRSALERIAPQTELDKSVVMDAVDFTGPIALSLEYHCPSYVLDAGTQRLMHLPMLQRVFGDVVCGDVEGCASLESRRYAVRLRSTRRLKISETITLPEGWSAARLPEDRMIDGPAASLTFHIVRGETTLSYECSVDIKKHIIPADEYANLREVWNAVESLQKVVISCTTDTVSASR